MAFSFSRDRWREYIAKRTTDFSAKVYKDGDRVYAVDSDGKTIAEGEVGVDDASVIQSALDSLTTGRTWKEKVILKGDFTLTSSIHLKGYVILDLTSATLNFTNGNIAINKNLYPPASDIEILGGYLEGNKSTNQDVSGISVSAGENIVIRDVTVEDFYLQGIDITWNSDANDVSKNVLVMNCKCASNGYNGIFCGQGSYNVHILNCKCENNGSSGVDGDGIFVDHGASWVASGGEATHNILISKCILSNNNKRGIGLYGSLHNIIVENCISTSNGLDGILIGNGTAHKIKVFNTICENNGQDGIFVGGGSYDIDIHAICISNTRHGFGIYTQNPANYPDETQKVLLKGIARENGQMGVQLQGYDSTHLVKDVRVEVDCFDNSQSASNTYYGVRLDYTQDCRVIGIRSTGSSQYAGIWETVNSDYNIFVANDVRGNGTTGMQVEGTNSVSANNIT